MSSSAASNTKSLAKIESGGESDQDLESLLMHAKGSTDGQKCALPRDLTFHKIVDWDQAAGRFLYDQAYANKQADWTYGT